MTTTPSKTRRKVQDLTEKGLTPREISRLLDISTQRVYQHLQALDIAPASKLEDDKAAS